MHICMPTIECYLQQHYYYRDHRNKNFYAITTLGAILIFLLELPILMMVDKTIGLPQKIYLYPIIVGIAAFQLFLTTKMIGDNDLTEKINTFYSDKKTVKQSKRIVLVFVILCVLFWVFAIRYDYD